MTSEQPHRNSGRCFTDGGVIYESYFISMVACRFVVIENLMTSEYFRPKVQQKRNKNSCKKIKIITHLQTRRITHVKYTRSLKVQRKFTCQTTMRSGWTLYRSYHHFLNFRTRKYIGIILCEFVHGIKHTMVISEKPKTGHDGQKQKRQYISGIAVTSGQFLVLCTLLVIKTFHYEAVMLS